MKYFSINSRSSFVTIWVCIVIFLAISIISLFKIYPHTSVSFMPYFDTTTQWYLILVLSVLSVSLLSFLLLRYKTPLENSTSTLDLQQLCTKIATNSDYSLRAHSANNQDIDNLYRSFNQMMDEVQKRDKEQSAVEESLRQSRNRFQNLVEKAPFCIHEIDLKGNLTSMNPAGVKMMEAENESNVCGIYYLDSVGGKDKNRVNLLLQQALKGVGSNFEFETASASGSQLYFSSCFVPLKDENNNVVRLMGITNNITERKRAEQSLRRSQKMDAVGQLTGGVAHDFNNILGIISGNLELLELELESQGAKNKRIENIKKSCERAGSLTRQLLGFSRKQATQSEACNINQLIEQMYELLARSVTPQILVERKLDPELGLTQIDSGDFQDALLNLVLNARDAIQGQGSLILETQNFNMDEAFCAQTPGAEPGNYIRLSVIDDGAGISMEIQERIFEPFFTTKQRDKGTGLGLAMVFGFIKRSNGFINVDSKPGKGTRFSIYLPKTSADAQQPLIESKKSKHIPQTANQHILVVDDEPDLMELAKESLELAGYKVTTASSGKEALKKLQKENGIDLLFSDVVMPGILNGYELAEQALKIRPTLKVLLTSGYTSKAFLQTGHTQFQGGLLDKPYNLKNLLGRIDNIFNANKSTEMKSHQR